MSIGSYSNEDALVDARGLGGLGHRMVCREGVRASLGRSVILIASGCAGFANST